METTDKTAATQEYLAALAAYRAAAGDYVAAHYARKRLMIAMARVSA